MVYQIEFDKRVLKDLQKLNHQVKQAVIEKCSLLKENPLRGPGVKHLNSNFYSNLYRLEVLRVWRVIYLLEGSKVSIILIGHRKDCYKRLKRI